MKKLFFLFAALMVSLTSAYAVKYRELGFDAKFSVYTFDSIKYLVLTYTDSKYKQLSGNTVIKFKLTNDKILRLENTQAGQRSKSKSVSWISGVTSTTLASEHYVFFELTPEIMEMMQVGIKSIVINTIPEVYYYDGDETADFAKLIYKDYMNLKDEFER
jgi:hypothetical protein